MKKLEKYRESDKPIHVVYVYLITEHKTCYVGRTKNLHTRDLSHRRGRKHTDGRITYDGLYMFCSNNNIDIPEPFILEENLTGIESLEKEDFWVNYYKNDMWNVLNKAKTGLKSGSLGHTKIWDYESCKQESLKYKTRMDFRKNSIWCWNICRKMGWLDEFIPEKGKKENGFWQVKENVLEECKKYKNISEFAHKSGGAYSAAKKNGWLNELPFKKETPVNLSFEEVWEHYQKNGDIRKTVKMFKTSYIRIKRLFNENGVTIGNHNRKDPLPEEIPIIVRLFEKGVSGREIERNFNISRKRIQKVVKKYYDNREKNK